MFVVWLSLGLTYEANIRLNETELYRHVSSWTMSVTMATGLPDKPFRSWRALVYYMKATASSTDGKVVWTICCRIQIQTHWCKTFRVKIALWFLLLMLLLQLLFLFVLSFYYFNYRDDCHYHNHYYVNYYTH